MAGPPFGAMPDHLGKLLTHMSHVKTSPKWSMRGRHDSHREAGAPGPGAYGSVDTENVKKRQPAFGFGTSKLSNERWATVPGPGQYTPEAKATTTPLWGFGTPRRSRVVDSGAPGPGSYTAPAFETGPKHSMASRREGGRASSNPGPGSYQPPRVVPSARGSPKFGFGTSERSRSVPTGGPGPGEYATSSKLGSAPMHSMAARRDGSKNSHTPGPGTYQRGEGFTQQASPRWGFGRPSSRERRDPGVPGPGTYGPDVEFTKHSLPKYSMGGSRKFQSCRGTTPGPGQYGPPEGGACTPRWVFGTDARDNSRHQDLPGPGAYRPEIAGEGPQFSMAPRRDRGPRNQNPGPGTYDHATRPDGAVAPSWGLKTSGRRPREHDALPGPGDYQISGNLGNAPMYSMTGRPVKDMPVSDTVGGQYTQFGY